MVLHVARRELLAYLQAPFTYVVAALFLFITGIFWAFSLDAYAEYTGQAAMYGADPLGPVEGILGPFANATMLMLVFVMPIITMRVLAEEQRDGVMALLLSAPISSAEIVAGKWLGLLAFFTGLLVFGLAYAPITLFLFGNPPLPPFFSALLGVWLVAALGSAVGVMASSLSGSQIIGAVVAWAVLLGMWILSFLANTDGALQPVGELLGLMGHADGFLEGLIQSNDVAWFAVWTAFFLFVAQQRVESHRWR